MRDTIIRACERLLFDYAWTQDQCDPEAFAALFHKDAEWFRPGGIVLRGRCEILDCAKGLFAPLEGGNAILHVITNFRLIENEAELHSTCYSTAYVSTPERRAAGEALIAKSVMIYRNKFRLEDGAFRISEHRTQVMI